MRGGGPYPDRSVCVENWILNNLLFCTFFLSYDIMEARTRGTKRKVTSEEDLSSVSTVGSKTRRKTRTTTSSDGKNDRLVLVYKKFPVFFSSCIYVTIIVQVLILNDRMQESGLLKT